MEKGLWEKLRDPGHAYRAKPFWSWNGELKEEELLRQIDVMKEMGFGGFFMHSRTGLKTEYLGKEWFSLIRKCSEYAVELGMEAWIYDEDRWPSGTCGGLVTRDPKYRMRFLSEYDSDEAALACPEVEAILLRYALSFGKDGRLKAAREIGAPSELQPGERYAVYAEERMQCGDFYNGSAYLDTMNAEATDAFLHSTLDRYAEECGDLLGGAIRGVFTDEPYRGALFNGFSVGNANRSRMIPYTGKLFEAYREKYGEDLCVPEIYYGRTGEEDQETSARYIDVLDRLFVENFGRRYADWCRRHGMILTGHILHEDSLSIQTSLSGSMMRFYEVMDYPGIDNLTAHSPCYWAAIQCASAARQLGKPFVLSELYGCTGWDMPLREYKRIGDWHALFGINLRCPHLSWYTMEGEAKRDYPTSILHQNAWYRDWKILEDHFARVGLILTEGRRRAELLVVHPVEQMWKLVRKGWMDVFTPGDERISELDGQFIGQCMELIESQHEFDYGDEELLAKYGSVGRDEAGTFLRVGEAVYRTVLLRDGQQIRSSTEELLRAFRKQGGKICSSAGELAAAEVRSAPPHIASAVREWGGRYWLFLLNLSETESVCGKTELSAPLAGLEAEEWDFCTLENLGVRSLEDLSFAPGQMRIFQLTERAQRPEVREWKERELPAEMEYALSEPNVLVLDRAELLLDGSPFEPMREGDILKLDRALRESFGLKHRGGDMVQPWFAAKYGTRADRVLGRIRLTFRFISEVECSAAVAAEYDGIMCNGEAAAPVEGRWTDACFRLFSCRVRRGQNEICVETDFRPDSQLEAVYLLGDFGVKLPNRLFALPARLRTRDLGSQGLPFYGGAVTFFTGIRAGRVQVVAEELQGTSLRVQGEGEDGTAFPAGVIAFPPFEISAECGGRQLTLTLFLTRRNTFGPHHLIPQPRAGYGPEDWVSEGEYWTEDYVLIPQGFSARVRTEAESGD